MRERRRRGGVGAAVLLGLGLVGCSGATGPTDPRPDAVVAEGAAAAPTVALVVDGAVQAPLAVPPGPGELGALRADRGIPWDQVAAVRIEGRDGLHTALRSPARSRPALRLFLVADAAGDLSLRAEQPGQGPPVPGIVGVHSLRVDRTGADAPVGPVDVVLKVDGEVRARLDAATLAALSRTADPRGRLDGWDLEHVLAAGLGGARVAAVSVVHRDPAQPPAPLTPLYAAETFFLVKHAKSGDLRVQRWPVGTDGGRPAEVWRDIDHLAVVIGAGSGPSGGPGPQ